MITSHHRSIRRIAHQVTIGSLSQKELGTKAMIQSPIARLSHPPDGRRRGVVLIVVLAMLGLLAVIGVTFATYSNQAQIASRRFIANTRANVDPDSLLNYALEQLINDTNNRLSSMRGHSLKRDMYGNDSVYYGVLSSVPNLAAAYANTFPKPQMVPTFTAVSAQLFQDPVTGRGLSRPARLITTNIPVNGTPFDGYDFTRWVLKLAVCTGFDTLGRPLNQSEYFLSQTVEVVNGAYSPSLVSGMYRQLLISEPDLTTGLAQFGPNNHPGSNVALPTGFCLDGRYLRSFNGPGVSHSVLPLANNTTVIKDWGVYPNMRLNQAGTNGLPNGLPANPDLAAAPALDEDYDAVDLENWFLALQSADGSITLPSFYRPGIVQYNMSFFNPNDMTTWGTYLLNNDWNNFNFKLPAVPTPVQMAAAAASSAKFLRPRAWDGHDRNTFPDLVPDLRPTVLSNGTRVPNPTLGQVGHFDADATTGFPTGNSPDDWVFTPGYDVDNDGDGYNDSVWVDLGFPVQTDPNGKKYKPLFAFLVVGLNGRLPLNTAGNLHDRNIGVDVADRDFGPPQVNALGGSQQFNHASHLGTSPNEINPKFALRHSTNAMMNATALEAISTWSLRGLLAGYNSGSTPLVGRWGDEKLLKTYVNSVTGSVDIRSDLPSGFNNPVRPGKSALPASSLPAYATPDASDDDGDAFDFLAAPAAGPSQPLIFSPERADGTYPSSSGNLVLGVERQRRFVTPTDPLGIGRYTTWGRQPLFYPNWVLTKQAAIPAADWATVGNQLGAVAWFGKGADRYGRLGHFGFYRAPGVSVNEIPPPSPTIMPAPTTVPIASSLLNTVHGYESFRNPLMMPEAEAAGINGGGFGVGMPYNFGNNWPGGPPTTIPSIFANMLTLPSNTNSAVYPAPELRGTFTTNVASDPTTINNFLPGVASPGGLMNRDEADEQNLYDQSDQFDSPFRASDLADLYLANSLYDDPSDPISSRLVNLSGPGEALKVYAKPDPKHSAPLLPMDPNFESPEIQQYKRWQVNPRKLFSHETWDTNRFSWANDNPGNVFGVPATPAGNANFLWNQSASAPNLSFNAAGDFLHFPTPSLALGDRRINLNFPLPAYSYQNIDMAGNQIAPAIARYNEPTRQKFLRETYQLMLRVLPPKAVDTALEKAQLAQFLVNLVDFRDPDGVMTQFSAFDPNTGALGHGLYQTIATSTTPSIIVEGTPPLYAAPANAKPLVLWGMEYSPVALNEALAYEFQYWGSDGKATSPTSQRRLFIELVNTLTASNLNGGAINMPDPSDQNMAGWQLVMTQDADQSGNADATGRPDPVTGQIPTDANNLILGKVGTQAAVAVAVSGTANQPMPAGKEVKAMRWDASINNTIPIYTVLANPPASVVVEQSSPDTYVAANTKAVYNQSAGYDALLPPVGSVTETEQGRYFWLYLMRPADPADPVNSPKVVVDSIRFSYMVSNAKQADAMLPTITSTTTHLYSAQRLQPYRGGHAVANPAPPNNYFPLNAYGYSEQTRLTDASNQDDSNVHYIGYTGNKFIASDRELRHTIGAQNDSMETWSLFQFNDRDFQSVGELLMVPGCGPGQFTKLFIENPPLLGKGRRNPTPPTKPQAAPPNANSPSYVSNFGSALRDEPPVYPYLVDRFFYTASQQSGYAVPFSTVTYLPTGTAPPTPPAVLIPDNAGLLYGSQSGDGWHKMLEFFEVPSSMNGAVGPVTEGENGDWFRQARVPGKLNLNLIVDEEVFMGLIDDPRVNLKEVDVATPTDALPAVASGFYVDPTTGVNTPLFMPLPNRGYADDPSTRAPIVSPTPMKRVFSDFLKLRHGGSGTLLAFGNGQTGTLMARERPYRSLSYPDINDTILRPAALPPSEATIPGFNTTTVNTNGVGTTRQNGLFYLHNYQVDTANDPNLLALNPVSAVPNNPPYLGDPGIRNIFTDYSAQFTYAQPPAIPFRRLFQLPDAYVGFDTNNNKDWDRNSNASLFGNPMINTTIGHTNLSTSLPLALFNQVDQQIPPKQVYPPASLFVPRDFGFVPPLTTAFNNQAQVVTNSAATNPTQLPRPLLGANLYQSPINNMGAVTYATQPDRRQHPFFRTEMLQKIMNLTTVRTQQFAVYVTVGFFEVKTEGNSNTLQPDILGAEIDANNRFTMFAVVDRTKAEGFNPLNPGNYRDLVDYSRRLK